MNSLQEKFTQLVQIMATLRSDKGCPWDRLQTHQSLCQHLIEEAYEVIETIDEGRMTDLAEELGDLLLQVVFHAQMASEQKLFDMETVLNAINEKLIRRHPHVFGDVQINSAEEQIVHWEQSKVKKEGKKSAIDGVPKTSPALMRAYRMQNKAATVGFDWPNAKPVWDKINEETQELREVVQAGDKEKIHEELGDLLFSIVNISRFLKVNPEDALRHTIEKFDGRFRAVETEFRQRKVSLSDATLAEMDAVWEEVKKKEKRKRE